MTRLRNIEIIRQACIKANPEIMELKTGCCVRDFFKGIGIVMAVERDFLQGECYDIFLTESDPELIWQQPRGDLEILGRPIRLADVLLMVGQTSVSAHLPFDESTKRVMALIETVNPMAWNLRLDTLDEQSDACLEFLALLLKTE